MANAICSKYQVQGYYIDRKGNVYREVIKKRCYTNNRDVDIKIFSYVDDEILNILCQANKYIKSISEEVWKEKIWNLYPELPLPFNINYHYFYYEIKASYQLLMHKAINQGYNKILDWIRLPENIINYYLEGYYYNSVKSLLADSLIPNQKSINYAAECGYLEIINLLADYNIFPNINFLLRKPYKRIVAKLLCSGKRPSQDKVNHAEQQKEYAIIRLLALYNIHPT